RECPHADTTGSASTPRPRPAVRDRRRRRALPSPEHAVRSLPHEGSMLRSKAIGGPSEEERTAMKRFDRVAAGVVFALAAALGPRGAEARDVTIELMNAQGQPSGHATIAPESAGVRLRVDVTGLAPGS